MLPKRKKKKDFPWRWKLPGSWYQLLRGARAWLHLRKTLTSFAQENLRQSYRKRVTEAQKSGDECWGRGTTGLQNHVSSACGPDAMDTQDLGEDPAACIRMGVTLTVQVPHCLSGRKGPGAVCLPRPSIFHLRGVVCSLNDVF